VNRRVLIIGYPYVDAHMGAVRLRRIARLLPRHGWEVTVLTHPRVPDFAAETVDGLTVEEVAAPDLTRLYARARGWWRRPSPKTAARAVPEAKAIGFTSELNRWLMIPDKQAPWRGPALRRGRELLRSGGFDAIFASIEPRTTGLVAARLSRETGVPCVVEYRDLWTGNPYYHITQPTGLHRWIHRRLERGVLRSARRVSAVCRGIADYLERTYRPVLAAPVALNYNFFDPAEYAGLAAPDPARPFTISYTGAMYAGRAPHVFFEGARLFLDRSGLTPAQFRFAWAGGAAGIQDLGEVIRRTGMEPFLDFLGQLPHREALRRLLASDAALLIQAPDDTIHIPGKLFEALGARVPLLALANPCEVTDILERCRAGIVCPHTAESVASALEELRRLRAAGRRWTFAEEQVNAFAADAAVGRLAALFTEACV
jgi:glycosyltransferase involved in cell wall biosynthesis